MKKYKVTLTKEEREQLSDIINKGMHTGTTISDCIYFAKLR